MIAEIKYKKSKNCLDYFFQTLKLYLFFNVAKFDFILFTLLKRMNRY